MIVLYVLTAGAYALLALHFWRTRWMRPAAPSPVRRHGMTPWERLAILVPLVLHTLLLNHALFAAPELRFGFGLALSAMLWLTALLYWLESLLVPVEGMQAFILGAAAVCAPLPALFPGFATPPAADTIAFRVHTILALGAYGLFTVAALHALLMTLVERRLHAGAAGASATGPLFGPGSSLPPLLTLERLLFRLIEAGFVLLSLTLLTGAIYSETIFGQAMRFSHKTLFAVVSWVIFAALLAGRYAYGWRGRTALRWTLAGFLTLLLAYVGSRFVLEVILQRTVG